MLILLSYNVEKKKEQKKKKRFALCFSPLKKDSSSRTLLYEFNVPCLSDRLHFSGEEIEERERERETKKIIFYIILFRNEPRNQYPSSIIQHRLSTLEDPTILLVDFIRRKVSIIGELNTDTSFRSRRGEGQVKRGEN